MIACGHKAWAIDNAKLLLPLTGGSGMPATQATLLGDIALVLGEAGDAEAALKYGADAFGRAVLYDLKFLHDLLLPTGELLCRLHESAQARQLLAAASDAI
jgi:hypothetical protein